MAALRSRREQMLQALKRDQNPQSTRSALLDMPGGAAQPISRETDATAEMDNRGLVSMQRQIIQQQDNDLEHLERSVNTTKHVALQINEETSLHNRLLDELEVDLGASTAQFASLIRLPLQLAYSFGVRSID